MVRNRGYVDAGLFFLMVFVIIAGLVGAGMANKEGINQSPSAIDSQVQFPEPTSYAVDTSGKLTPTQLTALNTKLTAIDTTNGGKQIAVLVVPTTGSLGIEEYGIKIADKWKVGNAGKDNGVILIVATDDRKIRIEVGTGAEADITDAQAGDIIRNTIGPKLHVGDWFGGISDGVDAINAKLN